MDKEKFREKLLSMGAIGPFVEQEVLKGQEPLAYAEIPLGEGEDIDQVYVMTSDKLVWVSAQATEGFMAYKTYFLENLLEYEYGKIPAPRPDQTAKRALLKLKFAGNSEVGIGSTADSPETASARHKLIVQGIDKMERQLRKLTIPQRTTTSNDNYCQEYMEQNRAH